MTEIKLQEIPTCVVCHNDLTEDLNATRCGHVFHRECIDKSILMNSRCPTCRKPVEKKNLVSLVYKIADKIHQISIESDDDNKILLSRLKFNGEENFDFLRGQFFLTKDQNRKLENKISNVRGEYNRLQDIFNESIKSKKATTEKICDYFKTRFETNIEKKKLENQNSNLKSILSNVTEEKISANNNFNRLEKENKYIRERINIFENCFNIEEIDQYLNELDTNQNNSLEEKNVILADLVRSLSASLREQKKIKFIDLTGHNESACSNSNKHEPYRKCESLQNNSHKKSFSNNANVNNDVNVKFHPLNLIDISDEESSDNSQKGQESYKNFYINCRDDSNLSRLNFPDNINSTSRIEHSNPPPRELWKASDLIINQRESERSIRGRNSFDQLKDTTTYDNINITVQLDDLNSRQSTVNNICNKSKSPFKSKIIPTFLRSKNDNYMTNSPTSSNLSKQYYQMNSVVNLNTASNISNFSNFTANSNSKNVIESSNQTKQSIKNYLTNYSQAEINNNSNILLNTSRSKFSEDSPALGKKNKRRYTKLKSLDKNQNLKQMTISSMLNLKNI